MKHIVSFSGGKDSTCLLINLIEHGYRVDEAVFVDTGKEFPALYNHIDKVEKFIQKPITRLTIDFDYWFSEHVKTKGKNKGKQGYGWPDFQNRWCTSLKRKAFNNYLKQYDQVTDYRGIAADENQRFGNNKDCRFKLRYPLVEWGITQQQALQFCYSRGFDWGGLYEDFHRVSCWCCPLSRIDELRVLYNKYPDLWDSLKLMDMKSWRYFKPNYSLKQLEVKFSKEK